METLLLPALNLAILVSVLVYFTRKPVKTFVASRHETLRRSLEEVKKQLRAAQAQFEEFSAKLKAVEVEEAAIRDQAIRDAKETSVKILQYATERSKAIVADARHAASSAVDDLRQQVRVEFVRKVIHRSEELVRQKVTQEDRLRMIREFSREMGDAR